MKTYDKILKETIKEMKILSLLKPSFVVLEVYLGFAFKFLEDLKTYNTSLYEEFQELLKDFSFTKETYLIEEANQKNYIDKWNNFCTTFIEALVCELVGIDRNLIKKYS